MIMENDQNKTEMTYGLAWKDEFNLKHEWVDMRPRRLFELVSELVESCTAGSDAKKLKEPLINCLCGMS